MNWIHLVRATWLVCFLRLLAPTLREAAGAQRALPPPDIPPEVAATHILKKVEPVYPAFARAAGMQGVVTVRVFVEPNGRISSVADVVRGWECLGQAAREAAGHYVFTPFERDGQPTGVWARVDVVFRLPDSTKIFNPPPPPPIPQKWPGFDDAKPAAALSPALGKWLDSYLHDLWAGPGIGSDPSMEQEIKSAVAVEVPTRKPSVRLYIISETASGKCGSGGCSIQLVEHNASGFRPLVSDAFGVDFYTHTRPQALYPDVFVMDLLGAFDGDITGYAEVGGKWVVLYCGSWETGVQVCRSWQGPFSPDWQLINAAENGDTDRATASLQGGADIKGRPGESALLIAIQHEYDDMAELLLAKGANPNADGGEALCVAASQGDFDIVKLLLDKGADIRVKDPSGHTPLALAEQQFAQAQQQGRTEAAKDLAEVVKLLKERGAN